MFSAGVALAANTGKQHETKRNEHTNKVTEKECDGKQNPTQYIFILRLLHVHCGRTNVNKKCGKCTGTSTWWKVRESNIQKNLFNYKVQVW